MQGMFEMRRIISIIVAKYAENEGLYTRTRQLALF